jgi:Dihaem cytochrome c
MRRRLLATISAFALISACAHPRLPDASSPAAKLYVEKCGRCHTAYNPHSMTAAMWPIQVDRMEAKMRSAGVDLSPGQREQILSYLTSNAGTQ